MAEMQCCISSMCRRNLVAVRAPSFGSVDAAEEEEEGEEEGEEEEEESEEEEEESEEEPRMVPCEAATTSKPAVNALGPAPERITTRVDES